MKIKFEAETLTNMAYDMSNTPRISFETLKGVGKASGTAVSGGIWSTREGIMFAGNADRVEEELAEIKEEQTAKNNNAASPNPKG